MEVAQRVLLKIGSLLLDYPGQEWCRDVKAAHQVLKEHRDLPEAQSGLQALEQLSRMDPAERESQYVQLFDFSEKRTLYLTRHEVGDDRGRGQRLVELQQVMYDGQCAIRDNTLPDYLPAWLEYLAIADPEPPQIAGRIAFALTRILKELPWDSPYHDLVQWLLELLPEPDGSLAKKAAPTDDERDMPFPLIHGDLETSPSIWEVPRR